MAAYWTVFSESDDRHFATACERAMDSERAFPVPAALKEIMRTRHEIERRAPVTDRLDHGPVHPWQSDELDAVTFVAKPTPWRVGTKDHERWLRMSGRLIALLDARLAEREAKLQHRPNPDLARRADVLARTLIIQNRWHEHFARTGESLIWQEGAA